MLLGFLVFQRSRRNKVNSTFLLFVTAITAWAVTNFLTDNTESLRFSLWSARLANFSGLLSVLFFWIFTGYFARSTAEGTWRRKLAIFAPALIISVTPLGIENVTSITKAANQVLGPGYWLIILFLVGGFIAAFLDIIHGYRYSREVLKKNNFQLMIYGTLVTFIFAIVTNVFLPVLFSSWDISRLGPVFTLFLVGTISYGIVRHRLFDIRAVVARSLGYLLSISAVAAIYGFIVFGIANLVFGLGISVMAQIFLSAATGFAALIFPYLRTWFDKRTSLLFYQDAYDPQELYTSLNRVLVSSLDIKYLMMQSLSVVVSAIKPDFASVVLTGDENEQRVFATRRLSLQHDDFAMLGLLTSRLRHKVILTDELNTERQADLHELLRRNDIAALVRLTQNVRNGDEGFGYLMLGVKKSGNAFTVQDARVLDTVANELIVAIQNALHYEEIQKFNLVLQAKVDEATRKLRSTNEKLKALDETKDDFISMASHQLRTPLTSVKGYLSMVLEGDAGNINETQRKMLSQAYTSSQRMVYLIADLLNVSRLKTGKFVIESGPTDLSKMIDEEIGQLTEAAVAHSLTLKYDKPKDFPTLMLDETKTRQVLMNFIDNAIYYTPKDGHITIELKDTGPTVEFRVIDDGIGVPKSEQHHLFTKFYRAGNARKARPDGTGLGLFMAKKVISAQNGVIIFDSKEGKGSTFGFVFDKSKLAAAEAEAAKEAIAVPHTPVQG
jgi:signal transduction histidine kinase